MPNVGVRKPNSESATRRRRSSSPGSQSSKRSIAEREQAMKEIEAAMSAPGFYAKRELAQPLIDRHQALMWELGDLMHEWEDLQK